MISCRATHCCQGMCTLLEPRNAGEPQNAGFYFSWSNVCIDVVMGDNSFLIPALMFFLQEKALVSDL